VLLQKPPGGKMLIPQMNAETIPIQDIQAGPKNAGLASYQPDSSFQKMIEKAMNESREADKARTEKQGREPRPENVREDSGAEKARQKDLPPRAEDAAGNPDTRKGVSVEENARKADMARAALDEDSLALTETLFDAGKVDAEMELTLGGETEKTEEPAVEAPLPQDALLMEALGPGAATQAEGGAKAEEKPVKVNAQPEKDPGEGLAEKASLAAVNLAPMGELSAAGESPAEPPGKESSPARQIDGKKLFAGDEPLITVTDLRAREQPGEEKSGEFQRDGTPLFAGNEAKPAAGAAAAGEKGAGAESRFASMLSQEIQNHAADFVKTGSIILRDNDAGTIRLVLNPRELGEVKIHLQLTDNNIEARIAVASKEAFDAFKSSMDSLKAAFASGGFSTGDFNLSWTGGSGESQQGKQNPQGFENAAFEYASLAPDAESGERNFMEVGTYAVNVMA
jgi:hypothetical protein